MSNLAKVSRAGQTLSRDLMWQSAHKSAHDTDQKSHRANTPVTSLLYGVIRKGTLDAFNVTRGCTQSIGHSIALAG
jgi:hypothetical protein